VEARMEQDVMSECLNGSNADSGARCLSRWQRCKRLDRCRQSGAEMFEQMVKMLEKRS
jgi:hypothetical protein